MQQQTPNPGATAQLPDLDDLLLESVTLSEAKRQARKGSKLTLEQQAILEANAFAEALEIWAPQRAFAHIEQVTCDCGHCQEQFQGWYVYQTQKRGSGKRLVQADGAEGLPASAYLTTRAIDRCPECLIPELDFAASEEYELLTSLGEPASTDEIVALVSQFEDEEFDNSQFAFDFEQPTAEEQA